MIHSVNDLFDLAVLLPASVALCVCVARVLALGQNDHAARRYAKRDLTPAELRERRRRRRVLASIYALQGVFAVGLLMSALYYITGVRPLYLIADLAPSRVGLYDLAGIAAVCLCLWGNRRSWEDGRIPRSVDSGHAPLGEH